MSDVAPYQDSGAGGRPGLGIARSILLAVSFYILFVAAEMLLGFLVGVLGYAEDSIPTVYFSLIIPLAVAWPPTIMLGLQWVRANFDEMCPLRPIPARIVPAIVLASFGASIVLLEVACWIPMPADFQKSFGDLLETGGKLPLFLGAVVLAPVAEELMFRGIVFHGYLRRYSTAKAVRASAMLFAIFHLNPWQAIVALPLGLWYARLARRTGSLLPSMLSHASVNFSSCFLIMPLGMALGFTEQQLKAARHVPPSMIFVGATAASVGGLVLWWQLARKPVSMDAPDELAADVGPSTSSLADSGTSPTGTAQL